MAARFRLGRPADSPGTLAYIGPGAGFAFLGSFLSLIAGFFMGLGSLLAYPFRVLWAVVRRRQGFSKAHVGKVIFLGLDGLDPRLTERYLAEGKLPNLKRSGSGSRAPAPPFLLSRSPGRLSPPRQPARYNIFDFLNRNLKSYIPNSPRRVASPGAF
jgi:hypothetical protein